MAPAGCRCGHRRIRGGCGCHARSPVHQRAKRGRLRANRRNPGGGQPQRPSRSSAGTGFPGRDAVEECGKPQFTKVDSLSGESQPLRNPERASGRDPLYHPGQLWRCLQQAKVNRFLLLFLLLNGLAAQVSLATEEDRDDAVRWLERMNRSVATLPYEGRFVYLSGDSIEVMHIRHQIIDGKPRESLLSLNGIERKVIREDHTLTIITRVDGKLHRTQHPSTGKLLPLKLLDPHALQNHYRILPGKFARIAGRYGMVVRLLPRDDLRYGYRLVLDKESALPLDLAVMDGS
ncbi:MAG TPA: hypothetical protein EYP90_06395, partial [Chromatiaceae bacterium]|nr:hypothetical protein [Chromatiaceae bacterium]